MKKIIKFFEDVIRETKKVDWPNKKELIGATGAVLLLTLFMVVYVAILDNIFSFVLGFLLPG